MLRVDHKDGKVEEIGEAVASGAGADPMAFTSDWHRSIIEDFAEAIEIEPSAVIQFDPESFGMAANNGQMIEETNNKAKSAAQFKELARMLTHQNTVAEESSKGSLLSPLLGRLGKK